jgi:hypothetical protein
MHTFITSYDLYIHITNQLYPVTHTYEEFIDVILKECVVSVGHETRPMILYSTMYDEMTIYELPIYACRAIIQAYPRYVGRLFVAVDMMFQGATTYECMERINARVPR